MNTYTPEEEIVARADDDWVQFPEAYWLVSRWSARQGLNPRDELIRVLRSLIADGLLRVGDVRRGEGFIPWSLDEEATIARIIDRWDALDRELIFGDVCWLEATPAGKAMADDLLSRPDQDKTWISDA